MRADQALAYSMIRAAALLGERCPTNDVLPGGSKVVGALCRQGLIAVEISSQNYRRVTILTGDARGKATAPDPQGGRVWKVCMKTTFVNGRPLIPTSANQPSRPRDIIGGAE